ncbi:MAG: cytochrome c [Trichlorobacter sp.]|uniref:c-type cytochrome n=1 Tax=Trichlorobacter sp. TaxID=2911007 RepID=UPI00256A0E81|nr:cytochrome c [Trichlorobacter sp.]MDK9717047.1 cytochrome c [Trichlorobacter sp.]
MRSGLLLLVFILLSGAAWADMPGEKLFHRKCTMCHIVKGRGGAIGPELTKVAVRMSEAQLQAKIAYPKKSHPGSSMPSFATLEAGEMQSLISYLKTLK